MSYTYLTTYIMKNGYAKKRSPYLMRDIQKALTKRPGFHNAKSFWAQNHGVFYTISHWDSPADLEKWRVSSARNEVMSNYPSLMIDTIHLQIENFDHAMETDIDEHITNIDEIIEEVEHDIKPESNN